MRVGPLIVAGVGVPALAALWWYWQRQPAASAIPAPAPSPAYPDSTADQSSDAVSALADWSYSETTALGTLMNLGGLTAPRGIRNNNPGNVRRDGVTQWQGLADVQNDASFWQFSAPIYGLRVIAYLLLGYQRKKSKRTVRQMISEAGGWAPTGSADKNPASYADFVAAQIGVGVDTPVDLFTRGDLLVGMVTAIVQFENGQQPYTVETIQQAASMARGAYG